MTNTFAPYRWLLNNLSYIQTYILFGILFSLAPLPLAYFWTVNHLHYAQLIEHQLERLEEEESLKKLISQIQKHRMLSFRYLTQKLNTRLDMETIENQANRTWQALETQQAKLNSLTADEAVQKFDKFLTGWNEIKQQGLNVSADENERAHNNLIEMLLIQLNFLGDKDALFFTEPSNFYEIIRRVTMRLPFLQEELSQLALTSEKYLNYGTPYLQNQVINLLNVVQSNLSYLEAISSHYPSQDEARSLSFHSHLNDYFKAAENFIELVRSKILNPPERAANDVDSAQIGAGSETAFALGSQLWEQALKNLQTMYSQEQSAVYRQFLLVLIFTFLYLTAISLFGLLITRKFGKRLLNLTEATDSFTNGNLSVRVPSLPYHDEVGRQAEAFNRMAQKLEEIINHLYELLDATTAVSNGNLTTRIQVRNSNTEFDQVAKSFNRMAETFEFIIGRLQQIGTILSTSASEIASASKEQEIIIVEQEATTREIAIAANEISSTAREFATTMNDVSSVAEQTSTLASAGKTSLSNMESIMRQMVNASSNIAAKLAVLNEKAGNITSVITTITKVADQTNLLSLNASIEAEKAGEYGRSFAVIAREIRRLADQTAVSTLDIEKMVNEIMTAVSSSVMGVDDFTQEIRNGVEQVAQVSGQLTTIIEQVQAFTARFELVNQGMQAQSTGAEQINESISQLSQTAQQTSESIHQFHKTIQELNNAASELRILSPFVSASLTSTQGNEPSPHFYKSSPLDKEAPAGSQARDEVIGSMQQFNRTLNNLNTATNKLKNLNTPGRSSHDSKAEDK